MDSNKVSELAFEDYSKVSIQERLKALFKGRTLRQAALDWHLPYSTLNNYFSKGATPGLDVVSRIAEIEKIPVTWIIKGKTQVIFLDECHRGTSDLDGKYEDLTKEFFSGNVKFGFSGTPISQNPESSLATTTHSQDSQSIIWNAIFQALTYEERNDLIGIFVKVGANAIIQQFAQNADSIAKRSDISDKEDDAGNSDVQLKKGIPDAGESVAETDQSSFNKKVG